MYEHEKQRMTRGHEFAVAAGAALLFALVYVLGQAVGWWT